jgi:hypothetical protein
MAKDSVKNMRENLLKITLVMGIMLIMMVPSVQSVQGHPAPSGLSELRAQSAAPSAAASRHPLAGTLIVTMTVETPDVTSFLGSLVVIANVTLAGMPVSGAAVNFQDEMQSTFVPTSQLTNSTGTAFTHVTFSTISVSGLDTVFAFANYTGDGMGEGSATVFLNPNSVSELTVGALSVSSGDVSSNTTDIVSGEVFTDGNSGLHVAGATVTLTDTIASTFSPAVTTTDSNGNFKVYFTVGSVTVNTLDLITASAAASGDGSSSSTVPLSVYPDTSSDLTVALTIFHPAQTTEPYDYMVVGATVTSLTGPVAGALVTFSDSQAATFWVNPVATNSTGVAIDQVQFSPGNMGWDYFSATAAATGYTTGVGSNTVLIGGISGTQLQVEMSVAQLTVSGKTTDVVSGTVFTNNNVGIGLNGATVALSDSVGSTFSPASVTTDTSGGFRVTFLPASVLKPTIDYVTASASYSTFQVSASTRWLTDTPMASPDMTVQVTTFYPGQTTEPYNYMVVGATVTSGGAPVAGASVTFADTQGAKFWANPVLTGSTGLAIDQVQFTTGNTGWDYISATAADTGYTSDEGTNTVLIGSVSVTQLQVEMSVAQVTVSGKTTDVVSGTVFTNNNPAVGVNGATVALSDTVGSLFTPTSATTDTSGGFRVTFYPASVATSTIDYLTASASYSTYGPTASTMWLTDTPISVSDLTVQVTTFYPGQTTEPYDSMVVGATVTSNGVAVSGASVTFADTLSAKFLANPVLTNSTGVAIDQVQFQVGYTGWDYISATAADTGYLNDAGTNTVLIGTVSATQLQVEMSVSQLTVSGKTTDVVSGTVFTNSNPSIGVSGATVKLNDTVGSSFTPSAVTTDTTGGFRVTFYPASVPTSKIDYVTVSASYSSYEPTASTVWLTDNPVASPDLTVQVTTFYPAQTTEPYDSMVVGATVTSNGVAVSGASVTFADTQGAKFFANPVLTNSTGIAIDQIQFQSASNEWDYISATASGSGYTTDEGTNTVFIGAISATQLQAEMSVSQVMVSGNTTDVVSGTVFTNNNPSTGVSGATVTLSDTVGSFFAPSYVTTDTSGGFRVTFYPASVPTSKIDYVTVTATYSTYQSTASTMWLTDTPIASPDMTVQVTTFYPGQSMEPSEYMVVGATVTSGGVPLVGASVTFSDTQLAKFYANPVVTNASGMAIDQVLFTSGNTGWDYISATAADTGYTSDKGTNTVLLGAVSVTQLQMSMAVSQVTVSGETSDVVSGTVFTDNNPASGVSGATVTLSDSVGSLFTPSSVTTDTSGGFRVTFYPTSEPKNTIDYLTASASYSTYSPTASTMWLTDRPMAAPDMTVQVTTFYPGQSTEPSEYMVVGATVTSGGVPLAGASVTFADTQSSTFWADPVLTNTMGVAIDQMQFTSGNTGWDTILATATDSGYTNDEGSNSVFVGSTSATQLQVEMSASILSAPGGRTDVLSGHVFTTAGSVKGVSVSLSDTLGATFTSDQLVTDVNGNFATDFTLPLETAPTVDFLTAAVSYGAYTGSSSSIFVSVYPSISGPSITSFSASPSTLPPLSWTNFTVVASGGFGVLSYAYTGLPYGCFSSNVSYLPCKPTSEGTYNVTVTVIDMENHNVSLSTRLIVAASVPTISSFFASPVAVTVGSSTTFNVVAAGGTGRLTYTYTGLPPYCTTFSTNTLSCAPTRAGTFTVRVFVNDSIGNSVTATANVVVTTIVSAPTILSFAASPNLVTVGSPTTFTATASGGVGSITYTYTGLPSGCSTGNASSLSCRPNAIGSYIVRLYVNDSAGNSATATTPLTVNSTVPVTSPVISSFMASPAIVTVGSLTTLIATVSGGVGFNVFAYAGLPFGCNTGNTSSLSCRPAAVGSYNVRIYVNDTVGHSATATAPVVVTSSSSGSAIVISPFAANPDIVTVGTTTTLTATVSGGTGTYTIAYAGLPAGCLSSNTTTLACKPTVAGSYTIRVYANDTAGHSASTTTPLLVTSSSSGTAPVISSFVATPDIVALGSTTTLTVSASGGTGSYTIAYAGLPAGCLSANTTALPCKPTAAGSYTIRVYINDTAGRGASTTTPLVVTSSSSGTVPVISSFEADPDIVAPNSPTTLTVVSSGGVGYDTFTYAGLPAGCVSSNSTSLSCLPTNTGSYTIRVYVNDSAGHSATTTTALIVSSSSTTTSSQFLGLSSVGVIVLIVVVAIVMVVVGFFLNMLLAKMKKNQEKGKKGSDKDSDKDSDKEDQNSDKGERDSDAEEKAPDTGEKDSDTGEMPSGSWLKG